MFEKGREASTFFAGFGRETITKESRKSLMRSKELNRAKMQNRWMFEYPGDLAANLM